MLSGRLLKNFSYALISNIISMVVSILPTLVLPRWFGADIASYGYYQVYAFYISYVGMAHLGAIDGIYLKEGGKKYDRLEFGIYATQFRILFVFELLICVCIGIYGGLFLAEEYTFISWMVGLNVVLLCLRTYFLYIFQATNCIKDYAIITITERVFYAFTFVALLLLHIKNYKYYVIFDIVAKFLSLLYSFYCGRKILFSHPASFKIGFSEFIDNIKSGSHLMLASVSGMLVTGIVRWGIQIHWDIETFGKISLSLSACNIISVLINAVALVIYPELKLKSEKELKTIYSKLQNSMMIPFFGALLLYYPFKQLLLFWIPHYADSLEYLAVLFPISILTVKKSVLFQTYMKVLRMEKQILYINLMGLVFAAISTVFSVFVCSNLSVTLMSIVFNSLFVNIISEVVLNKRFCVSNVVSSVWEVFLIIAFVACSWWGGIVGLGLYLGIYVFYLVIRRDSVHELIMTMKNIW